MSWLALTLLLAAPTAQMPASAFAPAPPPAAVAPRAPRDDRPQAVRVTTTLVSERIPLPALKGPIELTLNALAARIELKVPKDAAAVAARISAQGGWICPRVTTNGPSVELRCRTRRLDVTLVNEGGKRFLDIQELRGLPWRDGLNGPPPSFYEPFRTGLGSGCPGDSAAGRGECALRDGQQLEAATSFRDALETRHRQMATVRLGDIALSTGDPTTAVGWYHRAGLLGIFGRVARARICEMDGDCLGSTEGVKRAFDASGLSDAVRVDLTLRAIRAEAFSGRFDSAITMLRDQFRTNGVTSVCRGSTEPFCRRLILETMRFQLTVPAPDPYAVLHVGDAAETSGDDDEAARKQVETQRRQARELADTSIEVYMALPQWDRGLLAVELAAAAADLAGHIGAPVFGGNLLAIVAPQVPPAGLPEHLLRSAELFLAGKELARAQVVVEYLSTRLGKQKPAARLLAVQRALAAQSSAEDSGTTAAAAKAAPPMVDPADVLKELAMAADARARAKMMAGKLEAAAGPAKGEKK